MTTVEVGDGFVLIMLTYIIAAAIIRFRRG